MKIKFEETINVLKMINELKDKKIYSEGNLEEENDNIDDIDGIEKRFKDVINILNNVDKNNDNMVVKSLIDLHLVYSDFIWQYEQMHEMIKRAIAEYRE